MLSKSFFDSISKSANVEIWAVNKPQFAGDLKFKPFPNTKNNKERVNYLRFANDKAWSLRLKATSILSMEAFNLKHTKRSWMYKVIHFVAWLIYIFHLEKFSEALVHRAVANQDRSPDAMARLKELMPDVVLVTNPFWLYETSVAIEAKKLGIKVIALIPSWDNITTKSRITFDADAYMVWSELRTKELLKYYPATKNKPIYEVGTPQYEVFFDKHRIWSREDFCKEYGLDASKKIVLYATGSPNFLKTEYDGAINFAEMFSQNDDFLNAQLLIRPHPNKDNNELQYLNNPDKRVFIQFTPQEGLPTYKRDLDEKSIALWVNTFYHADVVINLSSTVLLDAIAFDTPVININFDPHPAKTYESFIKEINSTWSHLLSVKECKQIPQVNSYEELTTEVKRYLDNPEDGRLERQKLFKAVCGTPQNHPGNQLANTLISNI